MVDIAQGGGMVRRMSNEPRPFNETTTALVLCSAGILAVFAVIFLFLSVVVSQIDDYASSRGHVSAPPQGAEK
jgi:heme/copper-type cytochrome/quinol oxidase subunit 1